MSEKNLKQADLLRMTEPYQKKYNVKIRKNDISQYVSGKVEPGQHKLFILSKTLGVSIEWLMGLDVQKEINKEETEKEKKNDAIADIILKMRRDTDFFELVQQISHLSTEQRSALKSVTDALTNNK